MTRGPIVLIEDDLEDIEIFNEVLKELEISNRLITFLNPSDAYHFLDSNDEQPFLIICDVNMSGMNGMEFKDKIDSNEKLKKKSIPFIFYSTAAEKKFVIEAYMKLTVQGYFKKGDNYQEIKSQLRRIFEYWRICLHPNN